MNKTLISLGLILILTLTFANALSLNETQARNLIAGDSYVIQNNGNTNYGSEEEIGSYSRDSSRNWRAYIFINISKELNLNNFKIDNMILNLTQYNYNPSNSVNHSFYFCEGSFNEGTITWNNQDVEINTLCSETSFFEFTTNQANGLKQINLYNEWLKYNLTEFTIKIQTKPESYSSTAYNSVWRSKEYPALNETPSININYSVLIQNALINFNLNNIDYLNKKYYSTSNLFNLSLTASHNHGYIYNLGDYIDNAYLNFSEGQYIQNNLSSNSLKNNLTFRFKFRSKIMTTESIFLFNKSENYLNGLVIKLDDNKVKVQINNTAVAESNMFSPNILNDIIITIENNKVNFYLNGVASGTSNQIIGSLNSVTTTNPIIIGKEV